MKKIITLLLTACMAQWMHAQPAKRQAEQSAPKQTSTLSTRAQLSFPAQVPIAEDVVWRRDIYRQLDLTQDANACLYYPVEAVGSQVNLFTYIFKLMMTGNIKAYEYRLDGNEVFTDDAQVKLKAFLDNYHIFYERTDKGIYIDNSDIPSREVTAYYLKESVYFDRRSATFHTKVLALCPIMKREDDFGDGATAYPLFWVKYEDLAPFLVKQTIMTSNLNNAAVMSMDDYFAKNLYRGKIYKTNNLLGKTLAQYCTTDSALAKEQRRIEQELTAFEQSLWGDKARKDSLDSIAKQEKTTKEVKKNRRARTTTASVKSARRSGSSTSSSSSAARITVRRQRH
ncbi:MAG: gliding motility protein GldN [Bacteroidales bacterium]|nr:gliding motility protein GldN [Bacteroidales bacterium]